MLEAGDWTLEAGVSPPSATGAEDGAPANSTDDEPWRDKPDAELEIGGWRLEDGEWEAGSWPVTRVP